MKRNLRMETLENREMLATDVGAVAVDSGLAVAAIVENASSEDRDSIARINFAVSLNSAFLGDNQHALRIGDSIVAVGQDRLHVFAPSSDGDLSYVDTDEFVAAGAITNVVPLGSDKLLVVSSESNPQQTRNSTEVVLLTLGADHHIRTLDQVVRNSAFAGISKKNGVVEIFWRPDPRLIGSMAEWQSAEINVNVPSDQDPNAIVDRPNYFHFIDRIDPNSATLDDTPLLRYRGYGIYEAGPGRFVVSVDSGLQFLDQSAATEQIRTLPSEMTVLRNVATRDGKWVLSGVLTVGGDVGFGSITLSDSLTVESIVMEEGESAQLKAEYDSIGGVFNDGRIPSVTVYKALGSEDLRVVTEVGGQFREQLVSLDGYRLGFRPAFVVDADTIVAIRAQFSEPTPWLSSATPELTAHLLKRTAADGDFEQVQVASLSAFDFHAGGFVAADGTITLQDSESARIIRIVDDRMAIQTVRVPLNASDNVMLDGRVSGFAELALISTGNESQLIRADGEPILARQTAAIAVTTQTAFIGTATFETAEDRRLLASFSPSVVEDGASGSLREVFAIAAANGQADEIRLGTGVYRLDLAADGDLDISESGLAVKIVGAGRGQTVIDATGLGDRAFDVWEGALLELEGVTILAGEVNDDGAGIRNAGTLVLRDVEIAGGTANGDGGAIFNSGTAQLESVRLVGNVALRGGGIANGPGAQLVGDELEVLSNRAFWPPEYKKNFNGAFGVGGGVMNWGHMELSRVQVISNQSDNFGGGIQNDRFLVMNHALLAENTAPVGSAIYSFRESPSLGSTPAETVLDDITLRGNTSAWDRDPVEQWYDTTVSDTNVVEGDGEAGFLAREAAFTVLEDSSENMLPLGALGWNVPITAALTRSGATATVSDGELVFSPQPDFCGLDLVVVVDANGVPHPIDVWVEPQNDPFMIDFPESIQVFTWEQAYLDPPFGNLTKAPYEVSIPVLENASYAPDIGERLTITSVFASHGGTVGIWDPNELTSREPEFWPDDRMWINYSPAAGFSGVETITYTVSDGNGAVSEFTVQAHVEDRDDVMQFRLEARNRAGEVIDRVRQGETIDVYVYVTSGLDETAIRSADAQVRYHPSQVERVGDVQFGDALPDLQWWGDTKSSGIPDLRTLGMKANGGFNVFDDPHQDLILAQFSLQVVGNQMVELAFDAKDCTGNLYDLGPAATIPYAAIEFVGLSLPVVTGWHNAEMPPDVDGNQSVVPLDALILVNELNRGGSRLLSEPVEGEGEGDGDTHHRHHRYFDVNNDGYLTPLDLVRVVNVLNSPVTRAEGEAGVNLASGVTAAWEPNAAARNTGSPAAFPPSAATDGGATVQRQDEVFSGWSTPILEDGLVDVLASGDRTRRTDADQEMKGDTDLLLADALLANAMDDAWDL
ncbi:MAG: hypothetical protein GX575_23050 [Candidatus Anammoximicrobium sp.]|nr:hypothetical protein [Candidatus Anammoximicrobium sp.]